MLPRTPDSYNERMLQLGMSSPYFIWPNVNPFRPAQSVTAAVPDPANIGQVPNGSSGLGPARQWAQHARQQQLGIFDASDPLQLEPFELRLLARRRPPPRWVIDLSSANVLPRPNNYRTIPDSENRLFIPPEYVPLFVQNGWQQEP